MKSNIVTCLMCFLIIGMTSIALASSNTDTSTPTPAKQIGYATTLGDNVPIRVAADPNSVLLDLLAKDVVVDIAGQEFISGQPWHIVKYNGQLGYIRADQLRWLSRDESLSNYGYSTNDNVNFRKSPGYNGEKIGVLNKYAFALVLDSNQVDGTTWYYVNHIGTEGYISSDFFHVLSMSELEEFLQSPEYAQGMADSTDNTNGGTGNNNFTTLEDWNVGTWADPNLGLSNTYEPFDPYTTTESLPTEPPPMDETNDTPNYSNIMEVEIVYEGSELRIEDAGVGILIPIGWEKIEISEEQAKAGLTYKGYSKDGSINLQIKFLKGADLGITSTQGLYTFKINGISYFTYYGGRSLEFEGAVSNIVLIEVSQNMFLSFDFYYFDSSIINESHYTLIYQILGSLHALSN